MLGAKIKELRSHINYTQLEFSRAIGINEDYLSKLENDRANPSDRVLDEIAVLVAADKVTQAKIRMELYALGDRVPVDAVVAKNEALRSQLRSALDVNEALKQASNIRYEQFIEMRSTLAAIADQLKAAIEAEFGPYGKEFESNPFPVTNPWAQVWEARSRCLEILEGERSASPDTRKGSL